MGADDNPDSLGKMSDAALLGKVFKISDPNPNAAAVVGATSFSESSPTLVLFSAGGVKKKIVSYLSLEQKSPVAGGVIEVLVFGDTVKRIAGGGNNNNQIQIKNPFLSGKFTPEFDFGVNQTLDVAGSAALTLIDRATYPAAVGATIELDCDEDWQFSDGSEGTIAIWIISSASPGLSFKHHIEVIQF